MEIIVKRGAGNRPGQDIQDALLSSVPVEIQRGRVEIDRATPSEEVVVSARYTPANLGDIVQVEGLDSRAKNAGITHSNSGGKTTTTLQMVRPII